MDMKGAEPTDTILTLEEALRQFARKRNQAGVQLVDETQTGSNVQFVRLAPIKQADAEVAVSDSKSTEVAAALQPAETNAASPAGEDLVTMVEGVPRTLQELDLIAAADKAYREDFPEDVPELENDEIDDGSEFDDADAVAFATHDTRRHDYAFTAMGTALMALVVVLMTRVPIVDNHRPNFPNLVAQIFPKAGTKALATPEKNADDVITTMVIIPDADVQMAAAKPVEVKSDQLEAQIKDTLKSRAFPDIGVSVSKKGEAFLAGEVYSLDEVNKIAQIVHKVNGVHHVHFLHPDIRLAQGPAFFGATTAWSPDVWGARVRAVSIGSPADKAGLQKGDVISEFDGKTIPDAKSFHDLMAQYSPGQRVQLRVWHKGQPEYLVARLGDQPMVASR